MTKSVLFVIDKSDKIEAQLKLANGISCWYKVFFLVDPSVKNLTLLENSPYEILNKKKISQNLSKSKRHYKVLKKILKNTSLGIFLLYILKLRFLNKTYNEIASYLKREWPDVIFVNHARGYLGYSHAVLKFSKVNKIPVIIPYLAIFCDGINIRIINKDFCYSWKSPLIVHFLYQKYKKQFRTVNEKKIFYYQPYDLLAAKKFGTLPCFPWIIDSSLVTAICVDSNHTKKSLIDQGVKKEKIHTVGLLEADTLFQLSLTEKKIKDHAVIALTPYFEHRKLNEKDHLTYVHLMIKTGVQYFSKVTISLHPKMEFERYRYLENEYPISISKKPLSEILHRATFFITGYSSTVVWATHLKIPSLVIMFNEQKLGLLSNHFYDQFDNIIMCRDETLLLTHLKQLKEINHDFSNDLNRLDSEAFFDGKLMKRYRALIQSVSKNYFEMNKNVSKKQNAIVSNCDIC